MTTIRRFEFNGSNYSWTVPANFDGTSIHVKLMGATGSYLFTYVHPNYVADGGYVEGALAVVPGDVLTFWVGGLNGYNGGGGVGSGLSGGGASDIRKNGSALTNRVAVAGGAGCGSDAGSNVTAMGGVGGASTGGAGQQLVVTCRGGAGGSQSAGGAGGPNTSGGGPTSNNGAAGALGQGGGGGSNSVGYYGGGGGGGYYGGGGGASRPGLGGGGGGGGGSNFVGGLSGTITNTPGGFISTIHDGYIEITYNVKPNAPTLTFPVGARNIDSTVDQMFTVAFSDDDPTDTISAIDTQYRAAGGSWNEVGKTASTTAGVLYPAGTFTSLNGQQVEWQGKTWDSSDAPSLWSASAFFVPWPPPAADFIFNPALTGIASRQPVVAGRRADSGPIGQYRFIVVPDDGHGSPVTGTVLLDSGVVLTPALPTSISVTLPDYGYVNSSSYHVLAMIAEHPGVPQHAWTDSGPLTVNIQPPPAPTISALFHPYVDGDPASGTVTVSWSNPTPSDPSLAAVSVDLYRREGTGPEVRIATGLPVNSSMIDYIPAGSTSGLAVDYRVVAYTATGASASSVDGGPGGMTFGVDSYGFDTISGPGIFGVDGSGFDTITAVSTVFGTDSSGFDTLTI